MLRMSHTPDDHTVRLTLEGKLAGPWVSELEFALEQELSRGETPALDLEQVRFVDAAGLDLLRRMRARGVEIVSQSGFVAELLRTEDRP